MAATTLAGALGACSGNDRTSASRGGAYGASARAPHILVPSPGAASFAALRAPTEDAAAVVHGARIIVAGGRSRGGRSTSVVSEIPVGGGDARLVPPLPQALHDAAAATVGSQVRLFGGGRSQGSDASVRLLPGPPQIVGRLPTPLDLLGAAICLVGVAVIMYAPR